MMLPRMIVGTRICCRGFVIGARMRAMSNPRSNDHPRQSFHWLSTAVPAALPRQDQPLELRARPEVQDQPNLDTSHAQIVEKLHPVAVEGL